MSLWCVMHLKPYSTKKLVTTVLKFNGVNSTIHKIKESKKMEICSIQRLQQNTRINVFSHLTPVGLKQNSQI